MGYMTYFDLVESLIVSSYGGAQDAEQRDIRTAIHRAYDELTTIRDWAYYSVHGRIILQEPYSTGTVSSSGATVTLSNGTWPTWAATGAYLKIGEEICRVASRTSGTVIVLDPGLSLKANVTDQPYTLYRSVYPLPSNFRNLDEPSDEYNWWSGLYVTPDQAMKIERVSNSSGEPYHWTVIKDPDGIGWAIKIVGYPTRQETIDFIYRRTARPIRWSGHEAGARIAAADLQDDGADVSWSAPDPAITTKIVGSVLRIGTTGVFPGPIESMTPYEGESLITGYVGARAVAATPSLLTGTRSVLITDPIDVAQHMYAAMDSCCDYWLARIRGVKTDEAFSLYQRDLRLAMEQDQLAPISGRSRYVWHDGGWRSPLQADVG